MKFRNRLLSLLLALAMVLTLMPVMAFQTYAAGPGDGSIIDLVWNIPEYQNTSPPQVKISWGYNAAFVSGTKVARYEVIGGSVQETYDVVGTPSSDYGYTQFIDKSVTAGKTYRYKLYNADETKQSNMSAEVTIPEPPASDPGGSGGSGGSEAGESGGSGSSESIIPPTDGPSFNDVVMEFDSVSAGEIRLTLINNSSDNRAVYGVQVRYNGNVVWDTDSHNYATNSFVTVPYNKTVTFEYRVFRSPKYNSVEAERVYTDWTGKSAVSAKLAKPKVSVTKISSGKAGIKWNAVAGATGYKVYADNKLIKTVGDGKLKIVYSKKGAGSKKYRVQAVIKNSAMTKAVKGPKSTAKKGKSNSRRYPSSTNPKTMPSFTANFDVANITLKGNTYIVTGYVLNNRIYDLQKYKRLDFTIYCDGKKVAHKIFRNLKCHVGAGDYKKMTIRIRGKGGVDFRNADGTTYKYKVQPYWRSIGTWTP